MKITPRRIAGMPELKICGAKKMRTPVEIWTSFRMTSGDQCSAFLTSSATTINVPNPKKRREKYIHSELVGGESRCMRGCYCDNTAL
jgi:hypothetical protein